MAYLFSLIGGLCSLGDMGFLGNVIFGGALTPAATRTAAREAAPQPIRFARLAVDPRIDRLG